VTAEALANRLRQRLGSVDDEQAADLGIQAALDQVVEQRLRHGGVLGQKCSIRESFVKLTQPLCAMIEAAIIEEGPQT
jgi:hypothetical protein